MLLTYLAVLSGCFYASNDNKRANGEKTRCQEVRCCAFLQLNALDWSLSQ